MDKKIGTHWFDGKCKPNTENFHSSMQNFSLGIFEWVARDSGKGIKRSSVKVRVSGSVSCPEKVEEKAKEIVALLDAGMYEGPKNVKV